MNYRPTRNQWILLARSSVFFAAVVYIQYACWLTSPRELGRFPLNVISGATSLLEWVFLPMVFYFTLGWIFGDLAGKVSDKLRIKRGSWLVTLALCLAAYFFLIPLEQRAVNALWDWTSFGWLLVTALQVVVAQPAIRLLRPLWRSGPRALIRGTVLLVRWILFALPRHLRSLVYRGRHVSSDTRQPWVTSFETRPVTPSHRSRRRRRRHAYNSSHTHRPYGPVRPLRVEGGPNPADEFFFQP